MVHAMEAWIVADPGKVREYYGQGFNPNPLPDPRNIESIERPAVLAALKSASRQCRKGEYGKLRHGAELLAAVRPSVVRSLKHAEIFFAAVEGEISGP